MKVHIQRYRVFLPNLYKWLILVIAPLVLLAFHALSFPKLGVVSFLMVIFYYMYVDLLLDFWSFNGICHKDSSTLDFLKSSFYGPAFLRSALAMDLVRRFVWTMALVLITGVGSYLRGGAEIDGGTLAFMFTAAIVSYTIGTLLLNILRYIDSMQVYAFALTIPVALFFVGVVLLWIMEINGFIPDFLWIILLIAAVVAAAAATAVTMWHMMYRIRRSYSDEK